jgi:transposase-like protein
VLSKWLLQSTRRAVYSLHWWQLLWDNYTRHQQKLTTINQEQGNARYKSTPVTSLAPRHWVQNIAVESKTLPSNYIKCHQARDDATEEREVDYTTRSDTHSEFSLITAYALHQWIDQWKEETLTDRGLVTLLHAQRFKTTPNKETPNIHDPWARLSDAFTDALFDKRVSRRLEEQHKRLSASFFAITSRYFKTPSASRWLTASDDFVPLVSEAAPNLFYYGPLIN